MPDAVGAAFGPLDRVDTDDTKRRWRLRLDAVRRLVAIAPEELAELESAASDLSASVSRSGPARSVTSRRRFVRPSARSRSPSSRPNSKPSSRRRVLPCARARGPGSTRGCPPPCAKRSRRRRLVEFRYLAQSTGLQSHQRVKPLGLLYGNRAFLVASSEWKEEPHLWRLANVSELRISEETFERDPDFDLGRYAKRSFGTFQEEPVEVVLRFAPGAARDASTFVFHPDQATEANGGAPTLPRPESNERRAKRNGTSRMPPALSGCHGVSRPSSQPQVDGACVAATRAD